MRGLLRLLIWIIGIIALVVIVALIFIYSGIYSVAANYPDKPSVEWALSSTMDNSVKHHARGIKVPNLDDPARVKRGLGHYREMCVPCHGAPGVPIGEVGKGLNPAPPELTEAAADWNDAELFWITKNGVRMSGMPAWGVIHPDNVIWDMVAFVRKLPKMTPAQYQALSKQVPAMSEMEERRH